MITAPSVPAMKNEVRAVAKGAIHPSIFAGFGTLKARAPLPHHRGGPQTPSCSKARCSFLLPRTSLWRVLRFWIWLVADSRVLWPPGRERLPVFSQVASLAQEASESLPERGQLSHPLAADTLEWPWELWRLQNSPRSFAGPRIPGSPVGSIRPKNNPSFRVSLWETVTCRIQGQRILVHQSRRLLPGVRDDLATRQAVPTLACFGNLAQWLEPLKFPGNVGNLLPSRHRECPFNLCDKLLFEKEH